VVVDEVEGVAATGGLVDGGEGSRGVVGFEQRPLDRLRVRGGSSGRTLALELEPGAQNSSTSWPRSTSASQSSATTSSTPP
jgi:hypothetical protein